MAQGTRILDASLIPAGYQQLTSLAAAAGLSSIPTGSLLAIIVCESQSVRWRDDGTDPTATVGMLMNAGDSFIYNGDLTKIKFIQTTASAKVNVSIYT